MATFWSDAQIEPKRKFKFLLEITGRDDSTKIPTFVVKKVTKPSFSISESKHTFLSHNFYFPGKLEWKEVDLTIVDAGGYNEKDASAGAGTEKNGVLQTGTNMSKTIMNILTEFGYQNPESVATNLAAGFSGGTLKTFSKFAGSDVLGSITIRQVDSNGSVVDTWTLKNAWIKDINFGEGDYSSDDLVEVQLKLRYDWAEYVEGDGSTGATIYPPRTP